MRSLQSENRRRRRLAYIIGGIIVALIVLVGGGLSLIKHNPKLTANFADNVLRPILGDKNVVKLEAALFGVQDKINQASKTTPDSADYSLVDAATATIPTDTAHITPPANLTPLITTGQPLREEGAWVPIAHDYLFSTFLRTDPDRAYSVVNLVYITKSALNIGGVAGTKHPGGAANPGPGTVPTTIQQSGRLIAAFNGGFREKDGNYGMFADGITYQPLRPHLPTLMIYKDDHVAINVYDGKALPADVVLARQNGPFLVHDSQIAVDPNAGIDQWAGTAKGGFVTWRSGFGVLPNGDLVFAVGPSLSPTTLAAGLQRAGAVNAIQLDINTYWVRFMLYDWDGKGSYGWSPLIKGLAGEGPTYLNGNEKDFFYLYKK